MIKRIGEFIENQGISIRAFEQKIAASNGLIRKALANNTDIQSKWLSVIIDNYPHLNPEWLLTGRGSMLRTESSVEVIQQPVLLQQSDVITLLKEQLREKEVKLEKQAQEIGCLKLKNEQLQEQVMGLDQQILELSVSQSKFQSTAGDAPSVHAHL